jgi:SAM-dependent methyltransferase
MKCRHCGRDSSIPVLDLGAAPPSNAYLSAAALSQPEVHLPLRLRACTSCWLVQTEDFSGREALFTEEYAYFSSMSSSWLAHARSYVDNMRERFGLTATSRVAEVASNDGYLLQFVRAAGIPCYGIEPTASTARAARAQGIETIESFFGAALAEQLVRQDRQVDLVAANNVLAHVPDINDFVAGFAALLKPSGVATFEFPHLLRMVQGCQFDTAYHEHYSYLSLLAVQHVFESQGLEIFDVERLATHGGSLRVFAQRRGGAYRVADAVLAVLDEERRAGIDTHAFYAGFQREAERVKDDFVTFLIAAKREGRKVGAYGAAAKGNTLLNFAGIRPDLIDFVVDRSPGKQGRYLPGSRIPIVDEQHMRTAKPDYVVLLPWNLRAELTQQLDYVPRWGGRFVTAVPTLKVTP